MTEEKNVIIEARDLWKGYNGLKVLMGLNLDVYEGETLVILGRSGVGKSVLLRQLIGIEMPDSGTLSVWGKDLASLSPIDRYKVTKEMGMLFQGAALFDSMTVGENTAFYLHEHRKDLSEAEIQKRVAEALEMVDLAGTEEKMPSDLSGGMRKRAALARLIVYRPKILLYDEPTTGLDPITAMHINRLINSIKKELQATSIVVTHDIKSAMVVGDRLAFHNEGKIQDIAPKDEFLDIKDPLLQSFFENAVLEESAINHDTKGEHNQ